MGYGFSLTMWGLQRGAIKDIYEYAHRLRIEADGIYDEVRR